MKRRKVLENPGELIKIKSLRARTTVDVATHVELEAEVESSYDRDFAEELGEIGFDRVVPIPGTLGLVTVEVEAKMDVSAPIVVSVAGTVKSTVDLKVAGITLDQDFYDASSTKVTSGSTEGSKVYIAGSVAVNAAFQADITTHASFKICFAGVCAGVAAEAMIDAAVGADAALTTSNNDANACDEWTMDTEHTKFAKYTDANKQPYEDAKTAAAGGLVIAGGAWLYVTMPYMKVYPVIGADVGEDSCSLAAANLFEFKPTASLKVGLVVRA